MQSRPTYSTKLAPITLADASASLRVLGLLNIPRLKDVAIKEYGEWLALNVSDYTLKAGFRQAYDITLLDGFEHKHIDKDQNPKFLSLRGLSPELPGPSWRIFVTRLRT